MLHRCRYSHLNNCPFWKLLWAQINSIFLVVWLYIFYDNFFDVGPLNEPENWYSWDGLFTLDDGLGKGKSRKQHFLGRVAKFSESKRCYQIWIGLNVIGIVIALITLYTCYFHFDYFHYRLSSVYANLGHAEAQHIIGERLLHGRGIEKNPVSEIINNRCNQCMI